VSRDLSVPVAKAFGNLFPDNPLKKLYDRDRTYLYALLLIYDHRATEAKTGQTSDEPLERVSKVLADAAKLAAKLESEVFQGPLSDVLRQFSAGYEDLPIRLAGLSERLGNALDTVGKRGHKREILATQHLVEASEFVRLRTGRHYDEHLAELFQGIGKLCLSEDLSSDAIRKKRVYAKKHYPGLCADASKRAKRVFERSVRLDPS